MSQLTFIPQRGTNASPGASTGPGSDKGHPGTVGDRNDRTARWSDVWSECRNTGNKTEKDDRAAGSTGQRARPDEDRLPGGSGNPVSGSQGHQGEISGAAQGSRNLPPGMTGFASGDPAAGHSSHGMSSSGISSHGMSSSGISSHGNLSSGSSGHGNSLHGISSQGHSSDGMSSSGNPAAGGAGGKIDQVVSAGNGLSGALVGHLAGAKIPGGKFSGGSMPIGVDGLRGAEQDPAVRGTSGGKGNFSSDPSGNLPGVTEAGGRHVPGFAYSGMGQHAEQTANGQTSAQAPAQAPAQASTQASAQGTGSWFSAQTHFSFASGAYPGSGVVGFGNPVGDGTADPKGGSNTADPMTGAGRGMADPLLRTASTEATASDPLARSTGVPGGAFSGTDQDMQVKRNAQDYRPVTQWLAMKPEYGRVQGADGAGTVTPGEEEKLAGGRLAAGSNAPPGAADGVVPGPDGEQKPGWKEKFRALFGGKQSGRPGAHAERHDAHIRSFAERGYEPVASGAPGTSGIAPAPGETVAPRPLQAVTPSPVQPTAGPGSGEQAQFEWEKIKMETDFSPDEAEERRDAALQMSQIGRLPLTSADLRRELLPGLVRIQQHARESAGSRNDAWQNHRIQIADGSNMRISTREVDGVLQLKLGSSSTELNRLLQQHFQEIREHLEKECAITVELQLDSGQADGFERFFGQSGKKGESERYREWSESRAEPRPVEKVAPQPIRNFGYNQMEWTI